MQLKLILSIKLVFFHRVGKNIVIGMLKCKTLPQKSAIAGNKALIKKELRSSAL